jgi:hypothetical protein
MLLAKGVVGGSIEITYELKMNPPKRYGVTVCVFHQGRFVLPLFVHAVDFI